MQSRLIINFLLFSGGLAICLLFNNAAALLASAVVAGNHLRYLKPQEWRLLVQLPVLGWIADAVLLRMDILNGAGDTPELARIACWMLLATTLCHSLYPVIRSFAGALLLGMLWGMLIYVLPTWLSGTYHHGLPWPLFISVAAIIGALLLLLFSFIIRTRIMPDIEKSR